MYTALWRVLPGPRWLRVVEAIAIALVVLGVCIEWVFPWIAANVIQSESTVGS